MKSPTADSQREKEKYSSVKHNFLFLRMSQIVGLINPRKCCLVCLSRGTEMTHAHVGRVHLKSNPRTFAQCMKFSATDF